MADLKTVLHQLQNIADLPEAERINKLTEYQKILGDAKGQLSKILKDIFNGLLGTMFPNAQLLTLEILPVSLTRDWSIFGVSIVIREETKKRDYFFARELLHSFKEKFTMRHQICYSRIYVKITDQLGEHVPAGGLC